MLQTGGYLSTDNWGWSFPPTSNKARSLIQQNHLNFSQESKSTADVSWSLERLKYVN
ncbi:hypothetical protein [Nostoc sp. C052]|uniref:hypothetical protein n=1 Tax=Nostoc sp. C052 TaxID=2576902 RepID=UPI0015C34FA2|nr:hypothetical protein [Nostoc sp. C052]